jgi:DNA helicase II / ATP-dependent DNA helicase PcrA
MPTPPQKSLNPAQRQAIEHTAGPALIVAGAGTGKTTVLIERLKYLLETKKASLDEILLLTFTEKGAGEMEGRALEVLPYGCLDLWISTFHGFGERLLRQHALDIGLSPDFKLLNQTEQWMLIKNNLNEFNLDYYQPLGNPDKFIYEIVKHFSRLKDENITPEEYLNYAEELEANQDKKLSGIKGSAKKKKGADDEDDETEDFKRIKELANAYHFYNQLLLKRGDFDFGDLINHTLRLFKERPNILKFYQNKFKYIMVDEFQDTNWAQYELVKILAGEKSNLFVVGDDDQAIYKFRGASLSNIMQFKDDYPQAKEVVLTENYRSGQKILDSAYKFIVHNNPNRLEEKLKIEKRLKSMAESSGEIEVLRFNSQHDEEAFAIGKILEMKAEDKSLNYSDFAILIRANSQADGYIAELSRKNIPNTFVSLRGLYYKPVIMDLIAYLKLLDNYHESSALFRVMNMPAFIVGPADIININRFGARKNWSLFESLQNIYAITDISPAAQKNITSLLAYIKNHSEAAATMGPARLFVKIVYDLKLHQGKDFDKDREYFSLLNQFYQKLKKFEQDEPKARLKDFMSYLDMEMDAGETGALKLDYEDADTVKIMTVHAAKGLEFKYVFLVGLVDKKFPSLSKSDRISIPDAIVREVLPTGKEVHLEEERRLFYVAMTRAKEKLFMTGAKDYGGTTEKKMSVFIAEAGLEALDYSGNKENSNQLLRDIAGFTSPVIQPMNCYEAPKKFSFSQIEAYNNCPLQYKFNFILKIPVPSRPVFTFGRVIHNTLHDFLSPLEAGAFNQGSLFGDDKAVQSHPDKQKLFEIYKKYWIDEGYDSVKDRDEYFKLGKDILEIFYDDLEKNGWPNVMYLEKQFLTKLDDYFFKGTIDRVDVLPDGTLEIMDYKTGEAPDKFYYQQKKQLFLYKLALEDALGKKASKLTFYYIKNNEKKTFSAEDKDLEKFQLETKETVEKICSGDFKPTPSMLCKYCDFRGICEARQT